MTINDLYVTSETQWEAFLLAEEIRASFFLSSCEAFITHSNISLTHMHRTLLTMLTTFSKFHNPKAFYKQEELWQLFLKVCAIC